MASGRPIPVMTPKRRHDAKPSPLTANYLGVRSLMLRSLAWVVAGSLLAVACGAQDHADALDIAEERFAVADIEAVPGAERVERFASKGSIDPVSQVGASIRQVFEVGPSSSTAEVLEELQASAEADG